MRHDYPAALVDEFQDTDGKQWDVFRRVYVEHDDATRPALFLIGDPKQAIYRFRGGDVHTYHAAGEYSESTETLDRNFRSRPRMIEAVAAVFAEGGAFPFADGETGFPAVKPGGTVADIDLADGKRAAPALHLVNLSGGASAPSSYRIAEARDVAAASAATEIAALLTDAPLILRRDGEERRVEPGDIAVLVNRHEEAERVQRELAARGIASVTATRASVFATSEATEILRILEALLATGDENRLRAALASVLVGEDAAAIDALTRDEDKHRAWLDAFQLGRQQWQRFGPLAFIAPLVAKAAPRLLKLADGERRMTNYLHIAEFVQEARARVLGEAGQADWLARRIADADDFDEAQQQRLESDAKRVRIMTLHRAKGLEFDLVFLPFAAIAPGDTAFGSLGLIAERVDGRRVLRARIPGIDDDAYAAAADIEKNEILAEQLRLLYVGLTRARCAAWLYGCVIQMGGEKSALSWLLHREPDGKVSRPKADAIDEAFKRLAANGAARDRRRRASRSRQPRAAVSGRRCGRRFDARRAPSRAPRLVGAQLLAAVARGTRHRARCDRRAGRRGRADRAGRDRARDLAVHRRALRQRAARRARDDRSSRAGATGAAMRRRRAKRKRCTTRSARTVMSTRTSPAASVRSRRSCATPSTCACPKACGSPISR